MAAQLQSCVLSQRHRVEWWWLVIVNILDDNHFARRNVHSALPDCELHAWQWVSTVLRKWRASMLLFKEV